MMLRREFLIASAVSWLSGSAGVCQEMIRIGYLSPLTRATDQIRNEAFRLGLAELGYISGKNIAIEERFAEGRVDRLQELALELVNQKVSLIVAAGGTFVAQNAKLATSIIPIVVTNAEDPTASGLVESLARPGGNVTGLTALSADLSAKRLQLFKEILPSLSRVGVLWHSAVPEKKPDLEATHAAAQAMGISMIALEVRGSEDFPGAFQLAHNQNVQAIIILQDPLTNTYHRELAKTTLAQRIPSMFAQRSYVLAGGLASYGPNYADLFHRAASFVQKILTGANPATLPFEQPTKFELFLNLKTAILLGIEIPSLALARADEVIE
jgi:putative tryptophan/tyrosine transport system substrate-binding protein